MSAFPGKVRILGVVTLRDMMDMNLLDLIKESAGFELLGEPERQLMVCDFVQARTPDWVRKPFFAELRFNKCTQENMNRCESFCRG